MDTNKYKILVVDDEEEIVELIEMIISSKGYNVVTAMDGRQALELLESDDTIDLVVSDIRMPHMDGFQLLSAAKEKITDSPEFVFITGYSDYTSEEVYNKGACAFIRKPFKSKDILDVVHEMLNDPKRVRGVLKESLTQQL